MITLKSKKRGFTIVELTTVMILIGIVFGIGLQIYRKERLSFITNQNFLEIAELVKKARNFAISSEPYFVNNSVGSIVPADGYGIYFNMNPTLNEPHVILFANVDGGNPGSINDDVPNQYDPNDAVLESLRLNPLIQPLWFYFNFMNDNPDLGLITQSLPGPPETINGETEAAVIFRPPLATTIITNNGGTDLSSIGVKYLNNHLDVSSPRRCPRIDVNHVRSFATIEYDPVCP